MAYARRVYCPRPYQFNLPDADMIKQPQAVTEQNWHQVNLHFVKQS
jgi:hypothetical protein